ncbi:hypothetical protein [Agromyces soli]|uniref:Uncharacterized protein n=1 Tax=Agromyces soli TaxID=659012 RepID=A0ABY4AT52_9MICO|nr:hypothetical protein [Agromyces soli]UOE25023.1 hypothetical protein MTP13_11735 [Agromyces soli]
MPHGARPVAVDAHPVPSPIAYRVPWQIDRSRAPWYALHNTGDEPAHGVHLSLFGDGRLLWQPLLRVEPGEHVSFVVRADDPARDCVAVLRWFRTSGEEYLWRIAF